MAAFDVFIWNIVFKDDAAAPVARVRIKEPARDAISGIVSDAASGKTASTTDGPSGAPKPPLDADPHKSGRHPKGTIGADAAGYDRNAAHGGIGVPVRIKIPSIALDAAVEKVALAADGSMGTPKHPLDTGWLSFGPRPGETGSAAISGHVDWTNGAAVFADLRKVRSGDRIAVQDDNGTAVYFVVRETRRYGAMADAKDVFSSHDGKAHLNLITCDGDWDARARQYAERLVVFTDKETE